MNANTFLHRASTKAATCAVATHKSTRYTSSQLHPSAAEIERCRDDIHTRMPQTAISALNQFLYDLFTDDDLVRAYFLRVGSTSPAGHAPTMPLDLCERAADRAGTYSGLLHHHECERAADRAGTYSGLLHHHERELAAVAGFVQSCGFYWCARQQALGAQPGPVAVSLRTYRSRITAAQRDLMQEPLRQLRRSHPELGATLAQVLGMDFDGDVDFQQVARIQAALGSAQMQVH